MKRILDEEKDTDGKRFKDDFEVKIEPDEDFIRTNWGTDYKIEEKIGEGVYGRVFRVYRIDCHDEKVAMKVLKGESLRDVEGGVKKEMSIMVKVRSTKHENLLKLHHGGPLQNCLPDCLPYALFMDLAGPSLYDIMQDAKKEHNKQEDEEQITFSVATIQSIGRQINSGMAKLDEIKVFHLDLKPENVYTSATNTIRVVEEDGRQVISMSNWHVKIGDFGCSLTKVGAVKDVQTQNYRAPEIMMGLAFSEKSDVWSLGCILSEMYTGRLLFFGNDRADTEAVQFEMMQWVMQSMPSPRMWKLASINRSKKISVDASGWCGLRHTPQTPVERPLTLMATMRENDVAAVPLFKLIRKILTFDPERRPSFKQLSSDPFFFVAGARHRRGESCRNLRTA